MIKKQTIRIEEEEYKKIKIEMIKRNISSFQDYVLSLIRKDLNLDKQKKDNLD